jgi:spermidine/putrescine transport system permease protein
MAFGAFSTGTADQPSVDTEKFQRKSPVALLLLLPGILYLILFFLTPLFSLVLTSFEEPVPGGFVGEYRSAFEWRNYVVVLETYWPHMVRSFVYALVATVIAFLVGYPIAYAIGVKLRRYPLLQALSLVLLIAPFFISFLLRTFAWKQVFTSEGFFVGVLRSISVLPPEGVLVGTSFSVIFGLAYNFLPFMALPIYTTLERLDVRLLEAGSDLYARPVTVFTKVTFPLSIPGVLSGILLTFIPASGDYINASRDFLGSPQTQMIGNVIEARFLVLQNFPQAAALSLVLMVFILVLVTAYVRRTGTKELV